MEAKFSDILAVLFFIPFLVHLGSADELDSFFGKATSIKDAMLYTAIIIFIISVIALIFVIVGLSWAYRVVKRRNRQVHAAPGGDQRHGEVDDFTHEAHQMVAMPRPSSMAGRGLAESQDGDDNPCGESGSGTVTKL